MGKESVQKFVANYLAKTGELYNTEAGVAQLKTEAGLVKVWGRYVVAGERRTAVPFNERSDSLEGRLALSELLLGPLANDYIQFFGSDGLPMPFSAKRSPWYPLAAPGQRRNLCLQCYQAFHSHALQSWSGSRAELGALEIESLILGVLGTAASSNHGIYEFDEARSILARSQENFCAEAVAAVVGLYLLICVPDQVECQIERSSGSFVARYQSSHGVLCFEVEALAREALLNPFWKNALTDSIRVVSSQLSNRKNLIDSDFSAYVHWDSMLSNVKAGQALFSGSVTAPLDMESEHSVVLEAHREALKKRFELLRELKPHANASVLIMTWWCRKCQKVALHWQEMPSEQIFKLDVCLERLERSVAKISFGLCDECRGTLHIDHFCYALYSRFLPSPGVDFHLEMARLQGLGFVKGWGVSQYQPGISFEQYGFREMAAPITNAQLFAEIGRCDSPLAQAQEMLAQHWRAARAYLPSPDRQEALGGLTQARCNDGRQPFQAFTVEGEQRFFNLILNGSLLPEQSETGSASERPSCQAAVCVDWNNYLKHYIDTLTAYLSAFEAQVELRQEGNPDDWQVVVTAPQLWYSTFVVEELHRGLAAGLFPEEVCYYAALRAGEKLSDLHQGLEELARLQPQARLTANNQQGTLLVEYCTASGQNKQKTLTYRELAECPEGAAEHMRWLFSERPFSLYVCACGRPCGVSSQLSPATALPRHYVAASLEPAAVFEEYIMSEDSEVPQASATPGSEKSGAPLPVKLKKEESNNAEADSGMTRDDYLPLVHNYNKKVIVTKLPIGAVQGRRCRYHFVPLTQEELAASACEEANLERLHQMGLDKYEGAFSIYTQGHELLAAVGQGAGSLAIQPELCAGLAEAAAFELELGFSAFAAYENLLVLAPVKWETRPLQDFVNKVITVAGWARQRGQELGYRRAYLGSIRRGHFTITGHVAI